MRAVGVIVEYNPFHNGHYYHLQEAKRTAKSDIAIAVMSGNFLQRGEPALVSKWSRTRMALLNGIDIVFELPYCFAVQKAEIFANGAVSILTASGCESLCFGSENGDISSFSQTEKFLKENHQSLEENIKRFIQTGVSYPKALALAYQDLPDSAKYLDLSKPNNILGFQYIKAIHDQGSHMKPLTVQRKNADYHDEHFASETIASATSIRKAIFSDDQSDISQYVPEATKQLLDQYLNQYGMFHHWEHYWPYLQYQLLQSSPQDLREIYESEEGLENRLIAAALEANTFLEFMDKIKTKRYTWTRLQRLCVHILTNTKKKELVNTSNRATYLRLLGMTTAGKAYLNQMKKNFSLPLISRVSSYKGKELLLDIKATRIYAVGLPDLQKKAMLQQEFQQPPIFIQ
ncbi:nucleotidyltransferase [Bacillus sp. BRMEA1]|uniref:nucleotidyltransferase n=1 Tax=Neobacillus endophyticus TaxID=2738405 RepID=UPI00156657D4|nr:nucleotidyltransferase [Neobacillus endophyticus]NRD78765.1 nucleotidyltransferase [Neobacillus endophyticus]